MKKMLIIAITALLCATLGSITVNAESYNEIIEGLNDANDFYRQMNNEYFEEIMISYDKFCNENYESLQKAYEADGPISTFSGCFYSSNNDYKLDLYLTDFTYYSFFNEYFPEKFTNYHIVNHSLGEFQKLIVEVNEHATKPVDFNIDIQSNALTLKVDNAVDYISAYNIAANIYDVDVVFEPKTNQAYTVKGGSTVYAKDLVSYSGTVTCCAYRSSSNQFGILTARHVISNIGSNDNILNSSYKFCKKSETYSVKNFDAVFIPIKNSNITYSWQYENANRNQTGTFNGASTPLAGTKVCILGKTTNERYAKIESTSTFSLNNNSFSLSYTFTGKKTESGDSGAPIVVFTKSGRNGRAWLVGMHNGIYTNQNKGYGLEIKNVCNKLGVSVCS